jgi:phage/plasmid-associated DNA primase
MEPEGVSKATEDYRAAEDWLGRFMESETVQDANATTQARALYERYKSWTKDTNEFVMKERRFNEAMDDHGFEHTMRNNKKLYTGIKLRDHMENFSEKYGRLETVPDDLDVF